MSMTQLSRRNFLKGAGLLTASAAAAGLMGCASEPKEEKPSWMPETWDMEADIVVAGTGGAGLSAAITVMDEGLGSLIVCEAAPEEERGGNTRVSGQLLFIPDTPEEAINYQKNLNGPYTVDEDLLQAWAENLCQNYDWLTYLGADLQPSKVCNPEYPDIEGSEGCMTYFHEGVLGQSHLWNFLDETAANLGCPIEYNARVVKLIFNPETKEVFGVQLEDGRCIKAKKGVVLALGGFENNPEMIRDYHAIGYFDLRPTGTPWNRGDGIKMAQSIGAQLWHMNSSPLAALSAPIAKDCDSVTGPTWPSKDFIYVGPTSKRYMYEEMQSTNKHGKMVVNGVYVTDPEPCPNYAIFGQKCFEAGDLFPKSNSVRWCNLVAERLASDNQGYVDAGVIVKADTVRELAEKIGLDPDILEKTVNDYNGYCETGVDLEYGRGQDVIGNFAGMHSGEQGEGTVVVKGFPLVPLEAPFYALRQYHGVVNTQGGPKRGTKGQVLDTEGNPIPRLYAAGEFGCIYSYLYNGGGNVSETVSSGRLAAREAGALTPWDAEGAE